MRLTELFDGYAGLLRLEGDAVVSGLSIDSRRLKMGEVFFAIAGSRHDGIQFIRDVESKGASAVVTDREVDSSLPTVLVRDIQDALAFAADRFFHHPSAEVKVMGVTGTNGKTTTSSLLQRILSTAGVKTALIGTVRYSVEGPGGTTVWTASPQNTTPDAITWQALLRRAVSEGAEVVVAEVSSHALSLRRVDYTEFHISIFTNLSMDHLDFHGSMEDYYQAKLRLFRELTSGAGVFNADDPYSLRAYRECLGLEGLLCGQSEEATYRFDVLRSDSMGVRFVLNGPDVRLEMWTPLVGLFNVYNVVMATVAALQCGLPQEVVTEAVAGFGPVDGRLQRIDSPDGFSVFVDYAHTPDALQNVLSALREITEGRLITLFGCGGNRDRGKRPLMGRVATELSDFVVITSDNPRDEPPSRIIEEILSGVVRDNYTVVQDRREAIRHAIGMATRGDVVLIAGKGHERYQEIRGVRYPFSDTEVIGEVLGVLTHE